MSSTLPAQERWITVYNGTDARGEIDRTRLSKFAPSEWDVWLRFRYRKTKTHSDKAHTKYKSVMEHLRVQCDRKQTKTLAQYVYSLDGDVIQSVSIAPETAEWQDTIPASIGEAEVREFCSKVEAIVAESP
jgi:hypothetical protein